MGACTILESTFLIRSALTVGVVRVHGNLPTSEEEMTKYAPLLVWVNSQSFSGRRLEKEECSTHSQL